MGLASQVYNAPLREPRDLSNLTNSSQPDPSGNNDWMSRHSVLLAIVFVITIDLVLVFKLSKYAQIARLAVETHDRLTAARDALMCVLFVIMTLALIRVDTVFKIISYMVLILAVAIGGLQILLYLDARRITRQQNLHSAARGLPTRRVHNLSWWTYGVLVYLGGFFVCIFLPLATYGVSWPLGKSAFAQYLRLGIASATAELCFISWFVLSIYGAIVRLQNGKLRSRQYWKAYRAAKRRRLSVEGQARFPVDPEQVSAGGIEPRATNDGF